MGRIRLPWPRRSRPESEPPASPAAVSELLERIRSLRLTLGADLAAAAGAVDADQPQIAADIVDADRDELQRLALPVAVAPQRSPQPLAPRRRRALIALPAIPLVAALAMTGAAALTGHWRPHHEARVASGSIAAVPVAPPASIRATAATTLHHLERAVAGRHRGQQVVTLAAHFHHQLSALIASSPDDGRQLGEVQRLLSMEQQLLESHRGDGVAIALAASRQVTKLLAAAGIASVPTTLPTSLASLPASLPPVLAKPTTSVAAAPSPASSESHHHTSRPTTTSPRSSASSSSPSPQHSHSTPPTTHRHHRHHHVPNPLFGGELLLNSL